MEENIDISSGSTVDVGSNTDTQIQAETTTVSESSNIGSGEKLAIAESATPQGTVLKLVADPVTGRKKLLEVKADALNKAPEVGAKAEDNSEDSDVDDSNDDVEEPQETNPQGLVPNQQQQQAPIQKQAYTLDELSVALQMGMVDESRLTPDLAIKYGQYKERMAQQQALANAQQQPKADPGQAEAEKARKIEFLRKVDEMARHGVMQEWGINPEELEAMQYSDDPGLQKQAALFNMAVDANRQRIFADVEAERRKGESAQNNQKAVLDSVKAFADAEIVKEPRYQEINHKLLTYYNELPFEKAQRYHAAVTAYQQGIITFEQTKDLEEYYNEAKKAVYASANKLSATPQKVVKKPPVVERPGNGQSVDKQFNPAALSKMNVRQRAQWFRENFKQ